MFDDIAPAKMAEKLDMVTNDNDLQWSFPVSTQLIPGLKWQDSWLLNQLKHHTENVSSKVVHGIPVLLHQDKKALAKPPLLVFSDFNNQNSH